MADRLGVESLDREGQTVVIRFRQQARIDPDRMVQIVTRRGRPLAGAAGRPAPGSPGGSGQVPAQAGAEAGRSARSAARRAGAGGSGVAEPGAKAGHLVRPPGRQGRPGRPDSAGPASWWTARATSGEVTPGFTKAEITRPAAQDPRAETGVFTKVGGLLGDLLGPALG